ncbi:MAG: homoserine O-succinyltransferase [Alphaproteobacteria bacterium]|nr:homoserine O-succinyltransferase [Alphaproteobacteria bacterium]
MTALKIAEPEAGDCLPRPGQRAPSRVLTTSGWRDIEIDLGADFVLENGGRLQDRRFRIRLYGRNGLPVIIAAGGVSAGRNVADAGAEQGWWRALARPNGAIDTNEVQLLGFDFLPGEEPKEPAITPADQARALAIALDRVGIGTVRAFVGASYGGYVALAFASLFPDRLSRLCVVSASSRPDPMATALRGVQRRIILLARECGRPEQGVALARELAMTTYRTADEFRARFESAPRGGAPGDPFDICEYLEARGRAYAQAMPASRYLTLSDSIDRANVDPSTITADCLFIASKTDRLVPPLDTEETARGVAGAARYVEIESLVGHDAFLCDTPLFADELKRFLQAPQI